VNGTPYLIDVGENAVRRLVQAGVDFVRVGRVFITHGHSDHTMGLPALLASQWEFQRRDPVVIYGPPGTQKLVSGALVFLEENSADPRYRRKPHADRRDGRGARCSARRDISR